jgi:hypothetical protein
MECQEYSWGLGLALAQGKVYHIVNHFPHKPDIPLKISQHSVKYEVVFHRLRGVQDKQAECWGCWKSCGGSDMCVYVCVCVCVFTCIEPPFTVMGPQPRSPHREPDRLINSTEHWPPTSPVTLQEFAHQGLKLSGRVYIYSQDIRGAKCRLQCRTANCWALCLLTHAGLRYWVRWSRELVGSRSEKRPNLWVQDCSAKRSTGKCSEKYMWHHKTPHMSVYVGMCSSSHPFYSTPKPSWVHSLPQLEKKP